MPKTVIAPIIESRKGTGRKHLSFATFFLRDMAAKGKLNEKDLAVTLKEMGVSISPDEVMEVIKDAQGVEISDRIADIMEPLASIHVDRN
ncbi:hypothetical protein [Pseudophaeobacter sp.]|uniref:hypothetical protein n=1 Tax=Pseudophaeobacter sp. TaxID=1971739 RepID=UPI00262A4F05|nr:hypothetical protein [Pseudophaeobacter sp.]